MKFTCFLILAALFVLITGCETKKSKTQEKEIIESDVTDSNNEQTQQIASPRKQARGKIGTIVVTVDYGSPGVKGRKIWGGLEEYGVVWRAGANETTSVEFSEDVMINDNRIKAGKYGLYMTPNETGPWIVIINTDWSREKHGAWGAYNYTADHDVLRLEVKPEFSDEIQERLSYNIVKEGIAFAWEEVSLTIPISVVTLSK